MKLHYFLGALILASLGNLAIISTSFASTDSEITPLAVVNKPSREEISAAITKVQAIGDYQAHFSATAQPLSSDVPFYQEYNYLLDLVTTATNLLDDYDNADVSKLEMIIAAADDAETACNLLFGTNRQAKTVTASQAATASSPVAATSAPAEATTLSTSGFSAPANAEFLTTNNANNSDNDTVAGAGITIAVHVLGPDSANFENTDKATAADIDDTTDTSDASTPAALAHATTATVTSCALGTLYLKERRTYRPGRH